jgi:hypothetical protein
VYSKNSKYIFLKLFTEKEKYVHTMHTRPQERNQEKYMVGHKRDKTVNAGVPSDHTLGKKRKGRAVYYCLWDR